MKRLVITFYIILFTLNIGFSCMWDYDTYAMEKEQFPTIEELISGNFLRHSPEFHQWRIKDREQKLKQYPDSIQFYDDMAVSFSKLGKDKEAIALMLKKESLKPNLYETYANLGTFYIHNKELEIGIQYIDKAITINPKAHFGREVYQRHVAEYVLLKKRNRSIYLPLNINTDLLFSSSEKKGNPTNFCDFLLDKLHYPDSLKISTLPENEIRNAIKGVSGMMRFGNYDSPVLLEVLSDLLLYNTVETAGGAFSEGAKHLAAMALLSAGKQQSEYVRRVYNNKAKEVIYYQRIKGVSDRIDKKMHYIINLMKKNEQAANGNYETLRANEMEWIASNKNVDHQYAKEYYTQIEKIEVDNEDGNAIDIKSKEVEENFLYSQNYTLFYVSGTIFFFVLIFIVWKFLKRNKYNR